MRYCAYDVILRSSAFLHPPSGGALNKTLYVSGPDSFSPCERVWLRETTVHLLLLDICSSYADTHGLRFNAEKTQLICFHLRRTRVCLPDIVFNYVVLFTTSMKSHTWELGHILSSNLDDRSDITCIRAVKDLNCKANSLFYTFHVVDPFVKCFLFKSSLLTLDAHAQRGLRYLSGMSVSLLPRFLPLHATREQNSDTRRFVAATASF